MNRHAMAVVMVQPLLPACALVGKSLSSEVLWAGGPLCGPLPARGAIAAQ